jgi:hypothetical protein
MNRFIAEKVMGLEGWYCPVCKRELVPKEVTYEEECTVCGCRIIDPDYTTPADYFALLQVAIGSEWWGKFIRFAFPIGYAEWGNKVHPFDPFDEETYFTRWLLAPENFARLVAEYHGWKEENHA